MLEERYRPEEIIGNLREADILLRQGKKVVDVTRKNRWCRRRGSPALSLGGSRHRPLRPRRRLTPS